MSTTNPRKIYRAAGLAVPDLSACFPHARELDHDNACRHQVLGDPELFAGCGYASHDEAALLYGLAQLNRGPWFELGAHTGWSTAHLAAPGNLVVAVEPEFRRAMYNKTGDHLTFLRRFTDNVWRSGSHVYTDTDLATTVKFLEGELLPETSGRVAAVQPVGLCSWDCLPALAERLNGQFTGIFIDGEHEPPFPLVDAMLAAPFLAPQSVVVFHDAIGGPVRAAVDWLVMYLRAKGKTATVRRYMTPQFLTAVLVGGATAPDHQPDPDFNWATYEAQIDREYAAIPDTLREAWRRYATGWTRRPFN